MTHTFLFEEGTWLSRGEYVNVEGIASEASGKLEMSHLGLRWTLDTELALQDESRTVLKNLCEVVASPQENGYTEWNADDPALGMLTGRFMLAGDAIFSTFESADGKCAGAETALKLSDDRYLLRGCVTREGMRIAHWKLELSRKR